MGTIVVRILKIEIPGRFVSSDPDISLASDELKQRLFTELEGMRAELVEVIRARLVAYFPAEYEVFVRLQLDSRATSLKAIIWVDVPHIRWPAGLLARRAWNLSVPILAHVGRDVIRERVEHVELEVDERRSRIFAFAPTRFWKDPLVLILGVAVLASLFWLVIQPWASGYLASVLGP